MAIQWIAGDTFTCLSGDTKPTLVPTDTKAIETDTDDTYKFNGTSWALVSGAGGGGGLSAGGQISFSGNASQTVFNIPHGLSQTPDFISIEPASTDAFGSFTRTKTSSNIVITYQIPPPLGSSNVTFQWGAGDVNEASGGLTASSSTIFSNKTISELSNTLGVTQTAKYLVYKSGSTFYAKNGDTGAIDSSNTNAATVIQFALDNLTAGRTWKETVKLRGDFTFTRILIPSYTLLDLTGAKIQQASATNTTFIQNADTTNGNIHIEIVGGAIDGNKAGQGGGGPADSRSMVFMKKCSHVWIHHGVWRNGNFHNFMIRECPFDVKITDITSFDARHEHVTDHAQGLSQTACGRHIIANNYFENVSGGNTPISTANVCDVVIANNIVNRTFDSTSGFTVNGLRNIIINNKVMNSSTVGIILSQLSGADYDASGSVIANNVISNCASSGITISTQPISDIVIANNFVDGTGTSTAGSGGILISSASNYSITGNIVKHSYGNGILVYATTANLSKHIVINNNICYNNAQQPAVADNNAAGIQVRGLTLVGDISLLSIQGNQCYDIQGTKTQKWGIRMLNVDQAIVKNNDVRGNLTAGCVYTTCTGTISAGNTPFD